MDLGAVGGEAAVSALEKALTDKDRRVRRAAALGLGETGQASAARALSRAVETDSAEDVVAAAEVALGEIAAPGAKDFLARQLSRDSRYWDSIRLGALIGLGKLRDASLAATFDSYAAPKYRQEVREAALDGWGGAAADDPKLAERLRAFIADPNRQIREDAIHRLTDLHHEADLPLFQKLAADPDPSVAEFGREAIDEITTFLKAASKGATPGP